MARPGSRPGPSASPRVAGLELAAGAVRAVVGSREGGRLRITGAAGRALSPGAVVAGLVVRRDEVASLAAAALTQAEGGSRASELVVALDGDDVRTLHLVAGFERETPSAPVTAGELERAARGAAADRAAQARAAVAADLSLRGIAVVHGREEPAGLLLDGRALASLVGFQGRLLDIRADLTVLPLVQQGAALAACGGRAATVVAGIYSLGRLLAASGVPDLAVVRVGPDLTSVAIVARGAVVLTRSCSIGAAELAARSRDGDAAVWAAVVCEALGEAATPERWLVAAPADGGAPLAAALEAAASDRLGRPVDVAPLGGGRVTRLAGDAALAVDDLVAAGAAALGAGAYA